MDIAGHLLKKKNKQQIYRAKFSSITHKDIQSAFMSLSDYPNKHESLSVDARQIIDLKVGVAFSRFQSLYLKKKFQNLNKKMVTFGPCQTPTLGFCVERYEQIQSFKPVEFFRVRKFTFFNFFEI